MCRCVVCIGVCVSEYAVSIVCEYYCSECVVWFV